MPFNLGSLGFLTPFLFTKYKCQLEKLFKGELKSTTRMRLGCTIYRYHKEPYCLMRPNADGVWTVPHDDPSTASLADAQSKWELMETAWMRKACEKAASDTTDNVMCYSTVPEHTMHVLNELVVDRGPNSNISMLELFADEQHLTTVQADGLCISTATGSTAYSVIHF
jgi:NAD kinase